MMQLPVTHSYRLIQYLRDVLSFLFSQSSSRVMPKPVFLGFCPKTIIKSVASSLKTGRHRLVGYLSHLPIFNVK